MLMQSAYLFSSKVLGFGIRILLPVFLVRIMTKADIGAYNQFFLVETLLTTLFQMGVSQSQFYFIPRDERNAGGYFLSSLFLNCLLFGLGYAVIGMFKPAVAGFIGISILSEFFWEIVLYGMLLMLNVTGMTYLMACRQFKESALFEINMQVLASIATLWAAFATRDLRTIFLALILSRFIALICILCFITFKQKGWKSERYFFDVWPQIRYGAILGISGALWTLLMRMHELTVSKFYDIETYAVYAQGLKQIPILQFYSQSVSSVALVHFATLVKKGDWEGVRSFWEKIQAGLFGIGIPVTLLFVLAAEPLVILMYTKEYAQAVPIYRINAVGMLFFLLNPTLVLRALDRNDLTLKVHLGLIVILPAALYLGMQYFGLIGIISIQAAVLIAGRAINHALLNRLVPVHLPVIPSGRLVWDFYRTGAGKITGKLQKIMGR